MSILLYNSSNPYYKKHSIYRDKICQREKGLKGQVNN